MRFPPNLPGARTAARLLPACLALACAGNPQASGVSPGFAPAPSVGPAAARSALLTEVPLALAFTFNAGAPLGGPPGIAPDGSLLAGTTDGYLHALRPDGSFRWSYTLRGRVLGRPAWSADGAAIASAAQNGLYVVDPEGTLVWVTAIPGGVTSAPVVDGEGKAWVTTGGGTLLAFGRRGGIAGFARLGESPALGPVLLASGEVAVATADGAIRVAAPYGRLRRAQLEGPLRELRAGGGLFALGAKGLVRLEESPLEARWTRAGVNAIACTRPVLVVFEQNSARWLSEAGEPGASVPLPANVTAAGACLADGSLLVASETGVLTRLTHAGQQSDERIPLGRVLGVDITPAGLAIVSYADGRIVGLEPPR